VTNSGHIAEKFEGAEALPNFVLAEHLEIVCGSTVFWFQLEAL